ncbi:MAG: NADH:flavin oxidoreductase [Candidatus Hodarchaeales archaeon]|jgi:2,4-dienoyl-CoA reductase-like NADH-dependent reductase (Old Yellow Enzyme family)
MFDSGNLGSLRLQNRFIRSATAEFAANEDGTITKEYFDLYSNLGKGNIGLIIQGHLYVLDEGKAHDKMVGISHDYHLSGLEQLVRTVHDTGSESVIAAQLNHGGVFSVSTKTASPREDKKAKIMLEEDIENVIDGFKMAAARAKKIGYDAIQIHSAHGYLISQFLSSQTNRRTDSWSGSLEGRAHLLLSIYQAIRSVVGSNYPVFAKINGSDDPKEGFPVSEGSKVVKWLMEEGLDAIEISGMKSTRTVKAEDEGYYREIAKTVKQNIGDMPLSVVGGLRSLKMIQEIRDEFADFVSLCRPFIREHDIVQKFRKGKEKADCISCNKCFKAKPIISCLDKESANSH